MLVMNGADADLLASFIGANMKLKYLGSKNTTGNWVLTGLTPMVPVILILDGPNTVNTYTLYTCESGSDYFKGGAAHLLGIANSTTRTFTNIIVPTADTLKLNFSAMTGGSVVAAFTME